MKYNLKDRVEALHAFSQLNDLALKEAEVEIKKVNPKRSLNQNNYLHLLLGAFGQHFGYSLEEAKQIYKEISLDIYAYTKKNHQFFRSSASLNSAEMSKTIDRFRDFSVEQDFPLPLATDQAWLRSIENSMEQSNHYL